MVNDTISDMIARIKNAILVKNLFVTIPYTNINYNILKLLHQEGFIESVHRLSNPQNPQEEISFLSAKLKYKGRKKISCITNLKRISKPGLRIYANSKQIPKLLGGMGLIIISTSSGIMTDREARSNKIGGELICSIW
uniref:Small ribosomal subunit protein uS8c n=1 Tax=Acetabularia acetabulum TaxID=35845 RepID=W6MDE3_ACEAT|nr:chloroplast 30S ribosomal protein S8 [Acetabularia acetabulum]